MAADRVPLEASRSQRPGGLRECVHPPPSTVLEATILVRRRADAAAREGVQKILRGEAEAMPRDQAEQALGADSEDLQRTADFAVEYGLAVSETNPARRMVRVSGTVPQMEAAFGVKLCLMPGAAGYLYYEGVLTIPAALDGIVIGVLGLDQRPAAAQRCAPSER